MTLGTQLSGIMNYNYLGATNSLGFVINSTTRPATFFSLSSTPGSNTLASLGDSTLGDESLGEGGIDDTTTVLPKFKNVNSMSLINVFEFQPIISSNSVDANWEILAMGTNATVEPDQMPTFLINKLRT